MARQCGVMAALLICAAQALELLAMSPRSHPMMITTTPAERFIGNVASCPDANKVLELFVRLGNKYLETSGILSKADVNLFGMKNNHLDPLLFNGKVSANATGDACLSPKCVTIFGKKLCSPELCVAGHAKAELIRLRGLSSLRIEDINCVDALYINKKNGINATGKITLHCNQLSGDASAEAYADLIGLRIPLSSKGSVDVKGLQPQAMLQLNLSFNLNDVGQRIYRVESAKILDVKMPYDKIDVHIENMGAFSGLASSLISSLKEVIREIFDLDGTFTRAAQDQLPEMINTLLPHVNDFLKLMPF